METWQATIKEVGRETLLEPTWSSSQFAYIKDEHTRKKTTEEFLVDFWGLKEEDVEWFDLKRIE